jgi:hypothetical protein
MVRAITVIATAAVAVGPGFAQETTCTASLAEFNELREGMRYERVTQIIGCEGSLLSSSELAGFKTMMYMWSGEGMFGANMNAMFQNGAMVMKAQFGLQ